MIKQKQPYSGLRLVFLILVTIVFGTVFFWDFGDHLRDYRISSATHTGSDWSNAMAVLGSRFILPWLVGGCSLLLLNGWRQFTQKKVHQRYQRLDLAVASTADMVFITNVKGHIEYINDAFTRITGWTREDVLGHTPNILKSGLMPPSAYEEMWQVLKHGDVWSGRIINRRKPPEKSDRKLHLPIFGQAVAEEETDQFYWAEQTISPMCNTHGRVTAYVAVQRDITEQVQAEQQRQCEESYMKLLAKAGKMIQSQDPLEQRLGDVLGEILKLDELEVENRGGIFLHPPGTDHLELLLTRGKFSAEFLEKERIVPFGHCLCGRAAQRGKMIISNDCFEDEHHTHRFPDMTTHGHFIVPLIHGEKMLGVLFLYTQPHPTADTKRVAVLQQIGELISLAIANDQLHQELSTAAAHQKRILDVATTAIFIVDNNQHITEVNDEFCRVTGFERGDILGYHCSILRSDSYLSKRDISSIDSQKATFRQRCIIHAKDKRPLTVIKNSQPLFGPENEPLGWIKSFVDVTELDQARAKAEKANEFKSQFVANMSHEIRTPMTAIMGYAQLLLEEADDHSQCLDYIQTIQRNGEHLLALINDILDISKIEAGHLEIEHLNCSPQDIVADVVSMMRHRAIEKGLALDVEYPGPIPQLIQTDPTRLRQILVNLVGNAIKFTEKGSVRIEVHLQDQEPRLRFDVIDTGIGITEKQISRLFNAFVQADISTTRRFGGTGLGLTISRSLAQRLGGDVVVTSHENKGSCFSFTIATGPLKGIVMLDKPREILDQQPSQISKPASPQNILAGMRLLVAEDGPDNQRLIEVLLKRAGAEVVIVENGQLAVDLVTDPKAEPFDVILMDMQMPVLDGYNATRALRRKNYGKPILAMTAHSMAEDRRKCLDAGCDAHISKPLNPAKLMQTIHSYRSTDHAMAS